MPSLCKFLIAMMICVAAGVTKAAEGQRPHEILIVADEQKQLQPLVEFLAKAGGLQVRLVGEAEMPSQLRPYYAVFQYIHGPMKDATGTAMLDYARGGGRVVFLHHALASARRNNPGFLPTLGVNVPPRDDPQAPWLVLAPVTYTLVNLNPGHYITTHDVTYDRQVDYQSADTPAGKFQAFDLLKTEAFANVSFTDGPQKTILFGFQVTDPKTGKTIMQDRAGWLKPLGKGWVFHFQPGHAESDYRNRNYCQIICNSLTWNPPTEPNKGEPRR